MLTREFDSRYLLKIVYGWIAQLVEHTPEERGVGGPIPSPATLNKCYSDM